MGSGHDLMTKHKSLGTWIFQSIHGSKPIVSAVSINKMLAANFFLKGREAREIKRKHQANTLLPFQVEQRFQMQLLSKIA